MPPKNYVKTFIEGGYYHIYNRGVAKQDIFRTEKDYKTFLYFLKEYLLPLGHEDLKKLKSQEMSPRRNPQNCSADIQLLAYCLMPNHFHILIKNICERGMEKFMRAFGTSYSTYFNRTYERVGPLFQGTYKAVLIETDEQLTYVSKYIHTNPQKLLAKDYPLQNYSYSSYQNYLSKRNQDWIQTNNILSFFSDKFHNQNYKSFVEKTDEKSTNFLESIATLLLGKDD